MKKKWIIAILIVGTTIASVLYCIYIKSDPRKEFVKFINNKPASYTILLLPLGEICLVYFATAINWEVLFTQTKENVIIESKDNLSGGGGLLKTRDHQATQSALENQLLEHTGRNSRVLPNPTLELESKDNEGEEESKELYYETINKLIVSEKNESEIDNPLPAPVANESINSKEELSKETFPLGVSLIGWGVSNEFRSEITPALNEAKESTISERPRTKEVDEIVSSLPDSVKPIIENNYNQLVNNAGILDYQDVTDLKSGLERGLKSYSPQTKEIAQSIISNLNIQKKSFNDSKQIADLLETDNVLVVNNKKEETKKQRVRKQLMENADFQQEMFARHN